MTLYDIDQSLAALMEAVDPETGEWVADPVAWEELNLEREKKIENTALFIKELRADIEKFKAEIETLQKRMRTLQSKEHWLLENLKCSLAGEPFETERCVIKFKKNPESVRVSDEVAAMVWARVYAPDCVRYKPPTLSLSDLKAELKKGAEIPGCELVRETRMEVK